MTQLYNIHFLNTKFFTMKNVLLYGLLLGLTLPLMAQKGVTLKFSYAPSWTFFEDHLDGAAETAGTSNFTYGAHAGVDVGYNFTDRLGISTGVGLAWVSQHYSLPLPGGFEITEGYFRHINYLRIPLLFCWNTPLGEGSSWRFYANAGLHLDVLTAAYGRTESELTYTDDQGFPLLKNFPATDSHRSSYNPIVLGSSLETGLRYQFSERWSILLALQGTLSLSDPGGDRYDIIYTERV